VKLQAKSLNIYGDTTLFQSVRHIADGDCECSMHIAPGGVRGGTAGAPGVVGEAHIAAVWLRRWRIVVGNDHRGKVQPTAHRPGAAGDNVRALLQVEQCGNLRAQHLSYAPNIIISARRT
jgi:hypothetical protein